MVEDDIFTRTEKKFILDKKKILNKKGIRSSNSHGNLRRRITHRKH